MAVLELFYPKIRQRAADAPDFVVHDALLEAMRDFCRKTLAWRAVINGDITAGSPVVDLTLPANADVAHVLDAWSGTIRLGRVPDNMIDLDTTTGPPQAFAVSADGETMRVWPSPLLDAAIKVDVAFMPSRSLTASDTVPDFLWRRWSTEIAIGAVVYMAGQPGMPHGSLELAATYGPQFERAISNAISEVESTAAPLTVATASPYSPFYNIGGR